MALAYSTVVHVNEQTGVIWSMNFPKYTFWHAFFPCRSVFFFSPHLSFVCCRLIWTQHQSSESVFNNLHTHVIREPRFRMIFFSTVLYMPTSDAADPVEKRAILRVIAQKSTRLEVRCRWFVVLRQNRIDCKKCFQCIYLFIDIGEMWQTLPLQRSCLFI